MNCANCNKEMVNGSVSIRDQTVCIECHDTLMNEDKVDGYKKSWALLFSSAQRCCREAKGLPLPVELTAALQSMKEALKGIEKP